MEKWLMHYRNLMYSLVRLVWQSGPLYGSLAIAASALLYYVLIYFATQNPMGTSIAVAFASWFIHQNRKDKAFVLQHLRVSRFFYALEYVTLFTPVLLAMLIKGKCGIAMWTLVILTVIPFLPTYSNLFAHNMPLSFLSRVNIELKAHLRQQFAFFVILLALAVTAMSYSNTNLFKAVLIVYSVTITGCYMAPYKIKSLKEFHSVSIMLRLKLKGIALDYSILVSPFLAMGLCRFYSDYTFLIQIAVNGLCLIVSMFATSALWNSNPLKMGISQLASLLVYITGFVWMPAIALAMICNGFILYKLTNHLKNSYKWY